VSGSTRTPTLVLQQSRQVSAPSTEQLRFSSSPRLTKFLESAARAGLDAPLAVRLALERALVLREGQEFRLDVERIRRVLGRTAREARATRQLSPRQADYIRKLYRERPQPAVTVQDGLAVVIPDDLLTQVRDTVPESALHEGAVNEMLAWERAARLEGRSMLEWALKALGRLVTTR
jgi:hypothetical protein